MRNSFLWFLAGLGTAHRPSMLYAPRSGDETRQALRARPTTAASWTRDRARQAREQATAWADRGRLELAEGAVPFGVRSRKAGVPEATAAEGGGARDSLIREVSAAGEAEERLWTIYRYSLP